jgi:hypothetical protein
MKSSKPAVASCEKPANAKNNTMLFDFLGNDALRKNSPLSFFKNFNVEYLLYHSLHFFSL